MVRYSFDVGFSHPLLHAGLSRRTLRETRPGSILKPNGDAAGDLDLIAANPIKKVLHIRECKDLEAARTPAETHNELERTFAVGGKKRSATDKHLDRIAWVEQNLGVVLAWLGITGGGSDWRVVGGFVVDTELLSPYVYECPLPVTPLGRLVSDLRAAEDE